MGLQTALVCADTRAEFALSFFLFFCFFRLFLVVHRASRQVSFKKSFLVKTSLTFLTLHLVLVQMGRGVAVERTCREESLSAIRKFTGKLSFTVLRLMKFKAIQLSVTNTTNLTDELLLAFWKIEKFNALMISNCLPFDTQAVWDKPPNELV